MVTSSPISTPSVERPVERFARSMVAHLAEKTDDGHVRPRFTPGPMNTMPNLRRCKKSSLTKIHTRAPEQSAQDHG